MRHIVIFKMVCYRNDSVNEHVHNKMINNAWVNVPVKKECEIFSKMEKLVQ